MGYNLGKNRKYTSKRTQNGRGLTLIELLIVISILGTVLAMAIPSFKRIVTNGNLKTAARDLVADFNALKETAISEIIAKKTRELSGGVDENESPKMPWE